MTAKRFWQQNRSSEFPESENHPILPSPILANTNDEVCEEPISVADPPLCSVILQQWYTRENDTLNWRSYVVLYTILEGLKFPKWGVVFTDRCRWLKRRIKVVKVSVLDMITKLHKIRSLEGHARVVGWCGTLCCHRRRFLEYSRSGDQVLSPTNFSSYKLLPPIG